MHTIQNLIEIRNFTFRRSLCEIKQFRLRTVIHAFSHMQM